MPPLSVFIQWRLPLIPVLLCALTVAAQANTDPTPEEKTILNR